MYDELVKTLQNMSKMGTMYGMAAVKMREAADAIEEMEAGYKKFLHNISELETEVELLKRKVKRKVKWGHWTLQYDGDGQWHCSECGSGYIYTTNFCSNCGADMRPEPLEE